MSLTSVVRFLVRKDPCEALLLLLPGLIARHLSVYHEHVFYLWF